MSASQQMNDIPSDVGIMHDCRCQDTCCCKPLKNPVRAERRKRNAQVAATAIGIDKGLNKSIDEAAEKLDIPREELATHFALKLTFGDTRPPTVFNGLMTEKSKEWVKDYDGPGRGFMPYVAKRIKAEGLVAKATKAGQSEKYINMATEARNEKRGSEGVAHTRAAAIKSAQTSLAKINKELMFIHKTTGIEYLLCISRAKVNDQMDPHYYASDKAVQFLEGNINVPVNDFLQLLDMSIVGRVGGLQTLLQGKKDIYRKSVRSLLNASYCQTLHVMGIDTTSFCHIEYTNYPHLVEKYRVVVRGYPLTAKGHLTQPTDSEANSPPPLPPFISVPGTTFEEELLTVSNDASGSGTSSKRKRATDEATVCKDAKKVKATLKPTEKREVKTKKKGTKSSKTITSDLDDDSDDGKWERQAAKQLNGEAESESSSDGETEPTEPEVGVEVEEMGEAEEQDTE